MIVFPNCKINIGLNITKKRTDGFHDLETIFYPVNLKEALELIPARRPDIPFALHESGVQVSAPGRNIVQRAWEIFRNATRIHTPIEMFLHKTIPSGAGLGGGSADAAFALKLLDRFFNTGLSENKLMELALHLGSDCPFFLLNRPVFAAGRGEQFADISFPVMEVHVLLINPGIHISTAMAFKNIVPAQPSLNLKEAIALPHYEWKNHIFNDFEKGIFDQYPQIRELKEDMYALGAFYASMSGTGSTVYGLFEKKPDLPLPYPPAYKVFIA